MMIPRSHLPQRGLKHGSTQTDPQIDNFKSKTEQFNIRLPENDSKDMNDEMVQFLRRTED